MLPLSSAPVYSGRMLRLVPQIEAVSPVERVKLRTKRRARPDGLLQCNRCGGRTVMTATTGVLIKNGRKVGGTVMEKDVCADCYRQGVHSAMMPELQLIK